MKKTPVLTRFTIVLFSLCLLASSSYARTWTNNEGKKIKADYISADGESVLLLMNGKEIKYAISKLSQEDRKWISTKKKEERKAKKEADKKIKEKTGRFENAPIHSVMFEESSKYFKDSVRKRVLAAFENGAFSHKGKAEKWLAPHPAGETCTIYVPQSYDHTEPYGLYVHIHSGKEALLKPQWHSVFDELKMIAVCADGSGNDVSMLRRVRLAIDAMATIEKDYKISPQRKVVGGNSGGGHMAMLTAAMFPDQFVGAISGVAQSYLPGHFPGMTIDDFKKKERKAMKWIVVSGDKDKNYKEIIKTSKDWKKLRMDYRFLDIPGTKHGPLSKEALQKALKWIGM